MLVAGQGLNDDMWHTLRFTRRANSIKFQVDDETPLEGELHITIQYIKNPFVSR